MQPTCIRSSTNDRSFLRQSLLVIVLISSLLCLSTSATDGTVTVQYGRISNMPDQRIHVAAALTLADCVRECVDFSRNYDRYVFEECFAYNFDFDRYTCELIHSVNVMNYTVEPVQRWQTGRKLEGTY